MNRKYLPLLASLTACGLLLVAGCSTELPGPPPANSSASNSPSLYGVEPVKLTTADFHTSVLGSNGPAMVDCYADWCGPCRQLAPIVAELAADYDGRVLIGKLDVDASEEIARKYQITSIPTVLFFQNGELVDRVVGLESKQSLQRRLDSLLQ
ncbi:thioredoxin [Lignipirellula cremea]|uniref:Thioredoxin n=1 Tax=Lignipirellula cremea TaxID=2528010 RepID=A0A518DPA1_9BACT|nr:thioredoxin [Lignipirellula cremea]QDU93656.1 Thioredoxin [Lignipirellula cremea]